MYQKITLFAVLSSPSVISLTDRANGDSTPVSLEGGVQLKEYKTDVHSKDHKHNQNIIIFKHRH